MAISRADSSRLNGAQSSGPVTPEGKAASSQNALKTGIFSQQRLLSDEDPAAYQALVESLNDTFNPASMVEHLLIDRMVMARQRLARLERAEAAVIELARNNYSFDMDENKWARFGGYGLKVQLSAISNKTKTTLAATRDALVESSLSMLHDTEKFVRLAASLHREFDTALRLLREEQARRVGAMTIERAVIASPPAKEEAPDGE
ncbi:MAG: hypothetical protein FJ196_05690 [Gammaproteobacteria bacterium]|nr:hypothetical protein [Gammaproteobacteria bacterium]